MLNPSHTIHWQVRYHAFAENSINVNLSFTSKRALTLGCGSGELERVLAKYNFCLQHDAIDISEKAIKSY